MPTILKGIPLPGPSPRGKEDRRQDLKGPGNTETEEVEPEVGEDPEAERRADVPRSVEPGTAAKNTKTALAAARPRPAVRRRPGVRIMVAVLHPLPDVADGVVNAERIGPEAADRRRPLSGRVRTQTETQYSLRLMILRILRPQLCLQIFLGGQQLPMMPKTSRLYAERLTRRFHR